MRLSAAQDRDSRLSLQSVYTALLTRTSVERSAGESTALFRLEGERGQRQASALEQLDRHPRLVLLGDPGSGKSTFVNFVALCLAGELLGREEANLRVLTTPLPRDQPWENEEPQPWRHGPLFPVRVVLRDFAARSLPPAGERAGAEHLWSFLERELARCGLPEAFPLVRTELLEGRGLVLLDGLDEVPEAERRRQQIRQAVESFANGLGESRVLLTSRTYAYQNQEWRVPGFVEAILAPFSQGQIDRFIGLWYEQMVALRRLKEEDARGRAELLRRGIFGNDRILGLAERPLLLTLIAGLHAAKGGSLPERRGELYAEAVDLLLNKWELLRLERDVEGKPVVVAASLAEWLRVDRGEVRQVLDAAAFEAHGAQPGVEDTADVEEGQLVGRLLRLSRNPGADAVALLEHLRDRAGLLVERGEGVYTFPHRTFQEYLAACHLTARNYPKVAARLGREDPGRWREVVLLAGAKAARGAMASVWSLADSLCHNEPGAPGAGAADEWGALLAGQTLAESADLAQVDPEDRPKIERVKRWLVRLLQSESFPALERAAAGNALAVLGDSRFDAQHWYLPKEPDFGFLEVPAGPFLMGSDPKVDPYAREEEQPQHTIDLPSYWLARYPVTVAQFGEFVAETGYRLPEAGWGAGPSNHPVAYVDWKDALAYCWWLEERLRELATSAEGGLLVCSNLREGLAAGRLRATLPSEAEWEKAARGRDGRIYPWGGEFGSNFVNCAESGLDSRSAVGAFSGGRGPYGHEELIGNVWEWTRSLWGKVVSESIFPYPYKASDGREVLDPGAGLRVSRGGSFVSDSADAGGAYRLWNSPDRRRGSIGFRVVLSPFPL